MTHAELVEVAARWLRRTCPVVITELGVTGENPDALGWRGWASTLVECKVSRADFLNDRKKWFRTDHGQEHAVGISRYYLTLPNLVDLHELPPRWGLIELNGQRIKVIRKAEPFESSGRQEIKILISALRRVGQTCPSGVSVKFYTIHTGNRATMTIDEEFGNEAQ